MQIVYQHFLDNFFADFGLSSTLQDYHNTKVAYHCTRPNVQTHLHKLINPHEYIYQNSALLFGIHPFLQALDIGSRRPLSASPHQHFHSLDWVLGATSKGVTITFRYKSENKKKHPNGINHSSNHTNQNIRHNSY